MTYNYWWQISTDNLSNLDSPKNFSSCLPGRQTCLSSQKQVFGKKTSSYNLSLQVQKLATIIPKRCYSTNSAKGAPVICEVDNINNNESIKFDSLSLPHQTSNSVGVKW